MGWTEKNLDWKRAIHLPERAGEDLRWFTRTSAPEGWIDSTHERQREYARRDPSMHEGGLGVPVQMPGERMAAETIHDKVTMSKEKTALLSAIISRTLFFVPVKKGGALCGPQTGTACGNPYQRGS